MTHTRTHGLRTLLLTSLLGAVLLPATVLADYILTAPPRESPEAGKKLYTPLADHLSSLLGEKVVYQHPGTWPAYAKNMKKGKYDIVFDGPHFAAWRIDSEQAQPLVKLPGHLLFVIVTRADRPNLQKTSDLLREKICTPPPPSLSALTLYSMFPNPMQQPDFVLLSGDSANVLKQLNAGKCSAAILRDVYYKNQITAEEKTRLHLMLTSKAFTNQGITVSSRVSAKARQSILDSLVDGAGAKAATPMFKRFSNNAHAFLPASTDDYKGHNLLRDNMIFGW